MPLDVAILKTKANKTMSLSIGSQIMAEALIRRGTGRNFSDLIEVLIEEACQKKSLTLSAVWQESPKRFDTTPLKSSPTAKRSRRYARNEAQNS